MTPDQSLTTLINFAKKFADQANDTERQAIEICESLAKQIIDRESVVAELKKRIDEHTLYLRSGWALEKPVAPDNTYDLLREISKAIKIEPVADK